MHSALLLAASAVMLSCDLMPGRPSAAMETPRPDAVMDFHTLYSQNCAGCHGADGTNGASIPLSDPLYQAIVDDATLRDTIANGQAGSHMPAFAQSAGGMLTDAQIDALVKGMRQRWYKPSDFNSGKLPPYKAGGNGNSQHGQQVYNFYCVSCHGAVGQSQSQAGAIVDRSFLSLIGDQALRTIVIIGRPDLGMPDWRARVPGHPMTDQEISDVVAWLSAQRGTQAPAQKPGEAPGTARTAQPQPAQAPAKGGL
jgi:cytochrome c oxidase cbb3-type subunit 3/ubiquinol-cytochrome c reductase cytochrome c subunit